MKIFFSEHNYDELTPSKLQKAGFEVFVPKKEIPGVHEFDRSSLLSSLDGTDVLVVGLRFKIDKEIIDKVGKAIFTRTTGLDHIDVKYCKEKGVEVINLKGEELGEVTAVPELVLGKMIELLRMGSPGYELKDKTLGIIGYGRIGNILGGYAEALGMRVLIQELTHTISVLNYSDIVSLHISSIEENRGFMDLEKFKLMKDGAFFLNSARDWLVDEEAFKWALDNKLNAAWVDFPLNFKRDNLITTNHIGGDTFESHIKTESILVDKIITWKNLKKLAEWAIKLSEREEHLPKPKNECDHIWGCQLCGFIRAEPKEECEICKAVDELAPSESYCAKHKYQNPRATITPKPKKIEPIMFAFDAKKDFDAIMILKDKINEIIDNANNS